MNRSIATLAVLALLVLPGCFGPGPFESPEHVYKVCAGPVAEVPDDAIVVDTPDPRLQNVEPVQRAIRGARENRAAHCVEVDRSRYTEVAERLQRTPLYEGDPHEWGTNATGLYVAGNETVVRVELSKGTLG